jgi:hypothetical protein
MFPGDVDILWPKAASPEGRAELGWEVDVEKPMGFPVFLRK